MPLTPRWILMLTLPPLMWAGNAVVGRLLVGAMPPLALNAMRWFLALLILLPLGWRALARAGGLAAARRRWSYLAALGLLGMGSYNALLYGALQTSTPINVTLIAASTPICVLLMGTLFHGVHIRRTEGCGSVLSLLGVAVVLSRGDWHTLLSIRWVPGDVLMLGAVVAWSGYTWLLARPPAHMTGVARPAWDWAEFLLLQVMFGCVWAFASAAIEQGVKPQPIHWSPLVWAGWAYVSVGPSVLAYWCWGRGVAAVGPALAAFFANLTPVFTAVMSAALLGEPPQGHHVTAFVLIALGIAVSSRKPPAAPPSPAD